MIVYANASGNLQFIASGEPPEGYVEVEVDPSASSASPKDVVLVDGKVVLRSSVTTWHIDEIGQRHAAPAEGRQPLQVAWNVPIVRENGVWRASSKSEQLAPAIKAECGRRIVAVASPNTQMNMTAARSAGLMSTAEKASYATALGWVADMRAKCDGLIDAADQDYLNDAKWPAVPAGVADLCAKY